MSTPSSPGSAGGKFVIALSPLTAIAALSYALAASTAVSNSPNRHRRPPRPTPFPFQIVALNLPEYPTAPCTYSSAGSLRPPHLLPHTRIASPPPPPPPRRHPPPAPRSPLPGTARLFVSVVASMCVYRGAQYIGVKMPSSQQVHQYARKRCQLGTGFDVHISVINAALASMCRRSLTDLGRHTLQQSCYRTHLVAAQPASAPPANSKRVGGRQHQQSHRMCAGR
eukprot:218083-Rhodomonas_salina.1